VLLFELVYGKEKTYLIQQKYIFFPLLLSFSKCNSRCSGRNEFIR